jgi:hypothetical protein
MKSSKAKGRRLQNYVRDVLRKVFIEEWRKYPKLEDDDIKSQTMGMTGEDIVLSPAARKIIPFSFECKNQERLNIWAAIKQAESNADSRIPIVVVKRNRSNPYVVIDFNEFIKIIRKQYV